MLRGWTEILPLFIIRILAKKLERFDYRYEGRVQRWFTNPRPDVYIKVREEKELYSD